jgi:hypothetical protein
MSDTAIVAVVAGRKAWERLKKGSRTTFADWLTVGTALLAGRAEAMRVAETNRPFGSRYGKAFGKWLRQHGFDEISTQERHKCILCLQNRDVVAWRATLPEAKQRKLNHPEAVLCAYRRATAPKQAPKPVTLSRISDDKPRSVRSDHIQIHWPQAHLKRGAEALAVALRGGCNDTLVLARAVLESSVRNLADVDSLLASDAPAPTTKAAATEVHAAH